MTDLAEWSTTTPNPFVVVYHQGMKMIESLEQMLSSLASRRSGLAICLVGHAGIGKTHTAGLILKKLPLRSSTLHATANVDQFFVCLPRVGRVAGSVETILTRLQRSEIKLADATEAIAAWLISLAPFVLHLEDVHEANPEQQVFWNAVAKAIKVTRGVGILATSRGLRPSEFEALPLEILSLADSQTLLTAKLGAILPSAALDWILLRANGNPLFLLEFLKLLLRQGSIWNDGSNWHWRVPNAQVIPSNLEALIENMLQPIIADSGLANMFALRILIADSLLLWQPASQLLSESFETARMNLQNLGVLDSHFRIAHPLFSEVFQQTQLHYLQLAARQLLQVAPPEMTPNLIELAQIEGDQARVILDSAIAVLQPRSPRQAKLLEIQQLKYLDLKVRPHKALVLAREVAKFDPRSALQAIDLARLDRGLLIEATFLKIDWLGQLTQIQEAFEALQQLPVPLSQEAQIQKLQYTIGCQILRHELDRYRVALEIWELNPQIYASASISLICRVVTAYVYLENFEQARFWLAQAKNRSSCNLQELAEIENTDSNLLTETGQRFLALEAVKRGIALLKPRIESGLAEFNELTRYASLHNNLIGKLATIGLHSEAKKALEETLVLYQKHGISFNAGLLEYRMAASLRVSGDFDLSEEKFHTIYQSIKHLNTPLPVFIFKELVWLYIFRGKQLDGMLALKYARFQMQTPPTNLDLLRIAKTQLLQTEARYGDLSIAEQILIELQQETGFMPWQQAFILERQNSQSAAVKALLEAQNEPQFAEEKDLIELELVRITQDRVLARNLEQRLKTQELGGLLFVLHRYMPELEQLQVLPEQASFRIANLGLLRFERNGKIISYKAAKGRELLALLSELRLRGQHEISQLELLDLLYPNFDETASVAALQQLIYRLRNSLGQNVIVRTPTGYALGAEVCTDAETFLQTADSSLWRGAWLADFAGGYDSMARNRIYQALTAFIENTLTQNPAEAARLACIWLEAEPYELDAVMLARDALLASGDVLGAEQLYNQAQVRFHEVGVQLSPLETRAIIV
jgi:DNA-binding SARP family transcriptional activator